MRNSDQHKVTRHAKKSPPHKHTYTSQNWKIYQIYKQKTNNSQKCLNKAIWENVYKNNTEFILLVFYSWAGAKPEVCGECTQRETIGTDSFSLCKVLPITDNLLVRDWTPCPFPCLSADLFWLEPVLFMYGDHNVCEFICALALLMERALFGVIHTLCLLLSFCLLFHMSPWTLKRRFNEVNPFRSKCSQISHYLHIVQLWVFVLVLIDSYTFAL